jgi:hypothetical protein
LALVNGDLVAGQTGHRTISGSAKIRQDLTLALGEYWGTDRFHATEWGSTLPDFIGAKIDDETDYAVRSEVSRVLAQYIAIQDREVYADVLNGTRSRFATADVIRSVNDISATIAFDTMRISISLVTQAGESVTLNRTVAL